MCRFGGEKKDRIKHSNDYASARTQRDCVHIQDHVKKIISTNSNTALIPVQKAAPANLNTSHKLNKSVNAGERKKLILTQRSRSGCATDCYQPWTNRAPSLFRSMRFNRQIPIISYEPK